MSTAAVVVPHQADNHHVDVPYGGCATVSRTSQITRCPDCEEMGVFNKPRRDGRCLFCDMCGWSLCCR